MKDVTQLLISVSSDGAILTFWLLLINQKEIFMFYKYELKKKKLVLCQWMSTNDPILHII